MEGSSKNMKYPDHFRYQAPQINLPLYETDISIFEYYFLEDIEFQPTKIANCKICEEKIEMISGSHVHSSYTARLKPHLRSHPEKWSEYLNCLAAKMVSDDTRSKYEHFQRMEMQFRLPKDIRERRFEEFRQNKHFVKKDLAGIVYLQRDYYYLRNRICDSFANVIEGENASIFEYIHRFTNKNIPLRFDRYRQRTCRSKCLIKNDGNILLDLERFLCQNMCFFDPENFDQCPIKHEGDIAIFSDEHYQSTINNFKVEIEKYPEFIHNKTFDHVLLKEVSSVEKDNRALSEMNRLLKIILAMITVRRDSIKEKINQVVEDNTGEDKLVKPYLAIQMWGPKFKDFDDTKEVVKSLDFDEHMFFTYKHEKDEDCPGFNDKSRRVYTEPYEEDGKVHYPCNIGGCARGCECEVCNMWAGDEVVNCPDHHPDHPKMFNPEEDILIERRLMFESNLKTPIFERPSAASKFRSSDLRLAGMKKDCNICRQVVKDHLKNHHCAKLHMEACEICAHTEFCSNNSFNLICYVCMKKFKSKYRLDDHMNIHSHENKHQCESCNKSFTTNYTLQRHIAEIHCEKISFDCDSCESIFTSEDNLKRHMEYTHSTEKSEHGCDICDDIFKRKDNLLRHKREVHAFSDGIVVIKGVNDTESSFKCPLCETYFARKSNLKRHTDKVHSQEDNSYICDICQKTYGRKDNLKKHMKNHM